MPFGNSRDIKSSLVIGFVKRRKGAAGVGRLKLRRGILASLIVFSQIKAAHLAVQHAGIGDVNGGRAGCQRLFDRQHHHFFLFFWRHLGLLRCTAAGDRHVMKVDVDRVQRDLRCRLQQRECDGLFAFKFGLLEIGRKVSL